MPKCKYCKKLIANFNKDVCPYCGGKNPIDENAEKTKDITKSFEMSDVSAEVKKNFKPKRNSLNTILCMLFGFFGLDLLYRGFKKQCLIRLLINVGVYGLLCLCFSFIIDDIAWIFIAPAIIVLGVYFIFGIVLGCIKNKKDSKGVFLI